MDAKVILGKIATPAAHFVDLRLRTGDHLDLSSNRKTVTACTHQLQRDPVVSAGCLIVKNHRRPIDVFDYDVHFPVIVKVTESRATAWFRDRQRGAGAKANIPKCAIVLIE